MNASPTDPRPERGADGPPRRSPTPHLAAPPQGLLVW